LLPSLCGVLLGHFMPDRLVWSMKPLGDGFIKLIKMIIAPIIFCTVVVGIAGMEDMKKVGGSAARRCCTSKSSRPRPDHRPGRGQRRASRAQACTCGPGHAGHGCHSKIAAYATAWRTRASVDFLLT
jgi:hypothetical protein